MSKFLKTVFFVFLVSTLYGCGPSLEDAKKLGFNNVEELKLAEKDGFKTGNDYAQSKGFLNIDELRKAEPSKSAEDYALRLGFASLTEMRALQKKGFNDFDAFVKSTGFEDALTYREAASVGIDTPAKYQHHLEKKKEEQELAEKRASDPYFDYPVNEKLFIKIISQAMEQSKSAANDMQRGGAKNIRDKSLCTEFREFQITDWFGVIKKISSNSDGNGVLTVAIAPNITVKTWNNAFSDSRDMTLITPGSALFNKASSMSEGQLVKFSGNFFNGDSGDCVKESSLTLRGKIEDPEFIFRFQTIEKR